MPSFQSDLKQEQLLSIFLDSIYKQKGFHFKRISEIEQQHRGIDLIITHGNIEYIIDEKAQLHYLNRDLPTFTFELSYLKDNSLKSGWLFDVKKYTQYYFLITGIFLKEKKEKLKNPTDIEQLKITSIHREKLIKHLSSIGLNIEALAGYDTALRSENAYGKNTIQELNPQTQGAIYYTKHLTEKPVNLQLRLQYLIDMKIGKSIY